MRELRGNGLEEAKKSKDAEIENGTASANSHGHVRRDGGAPCGLHHHAPPVLADLDDAEGATREPEISLSHRHWMA